MAGSIRDALGLQFIFGFGFGVFAPPEDEIIQETFNIARTEERSFSIVRVVEEEFER